jgi:hypothetical protein
MEQRRAIEAAGATYTLRNMPMRPAAWQALIDRPDTIRVSNEDGEMLLVPERGQLRLYGGFVDLEAMRESFVEMFEAIRGDIGADRAEFVAMDLVGLPDREWLNPLLREIDFNFFAEWMEMVNPRLDANAVPEFPDGVSMRRAQDADIDRLREIYLESTRSSRRRSGRACSRRTARSRASH